MAADKKRVDSVRVERVSDQSERKKALAAALAYIEKEFGKGSIMRMSDSDHVDNVEVVSTGSLWIWRSESGDCLAVVLWKSSDRKVPVRPR